MTDKHLPELMTVKEAAEYMRVSTQTIRRWANDNFIQYVRLGHEYRIICESLPKSTILKNNFEKS